MQAMAALHAGSYARARTLLEDAAAALSRDPDIADALARVLEPRRIRPCTTRVARYALSKLS